MASGVGAWEGAVALGAAHEAALDAAAAGIRDDALHADAETARRLREVVCAEPAMRARLFADRQSGRLADWLRALTLAEESIPGCEAGAQSPVIALARILRERGDYPEGLTAWIRSVSGNRFLPYGSLAERLRSAAPRRGPQQAE